MTKPAKFKRFAAALIMGLVLTTTAIAAPAGATKAHHTHRQARPAPPFDMPACLRAAAPFYGADEARAVCLDMRAGV